MARPEGKRLDALDALKALALIGILLNHFVEEFGSGPWFTNPSENWPDFATRMANVFPQGRPWPVAVVEFLGWLGDSGPGVFILVSGLSLTLGPLRRGDQNVEWMPFLKRRLLRIFPLYIAMHFVMLAAALVDPGNELTLASPRTLLSMLGLRFTGSLFFYISPAWWFVWLILQCYLVFPLLYRWLIRLGPWRFFWVTFAFTCACRVGGLLGVRTTSSLYFWMTGIFFGTRLAEFCAGMVLAVYLHRVAQGNRVPWRVSRIAGFASALYAMGLLCSFTYAGSVVSNLLVTLGLSGLFYSVWEAMLSRFSPARTIVLWAGVESFSVYLFHQPPLMATAAFTDGAAHVAAAALVIAASFPIGWMLSRVVDRSMVCLSSPRVRHAAPWAATFLSMAIGVGVLLVEPRLSSDLPVRLYALVMGGILLLLLLTGFSRANPWYLRLIHWPAAAGCFLSLFIIPESPELAVLAGGATGVIAAIACIRLKSVPLAWTVTLGGLGAVGLCAELILGIVAPIEAGRWGEYPALESHPTRVYGLKPNQITRLRYNNYDYVLRTNSDGLPGPEVPVDRTLPDELRVLLIGDAFTMPEGLEYERCYAALLEDLLRDRLGPRPVRVINAGVTGYGPVEESAQVPELAEAFRPDIILNQFFVNEYEEAHITPEARLENIGLVRGGRSRLSAIKQRSQVRARLKQALTWTKERITGNPSGWRRWKALLHLYYADDNRFYRPEAVATVRGYLEEMRQAAASEGADFLVFYVPGAVEVSAPEDIAYFPWGVDLSDEEAFDLERPWQLLLQMAGEMDVPVLNLTETLRIHQPQPVYFPRSWHWNEEGHRVVADALASWLTEHMAGERSDDAD